MAEFQIGGSLYRTKGKIDARQQFHIARRLAPLVGQIVSLGPLLQTALSGPAIDPSAVEALIVPFSTALAKIPDEDCDYVLDRCLSVVQAQRTQPNGAVVWADVWSGRVGRMMFEDITLPQMMQIAAEVLQENLAGFFAIAPQDQRDTIVPLTAATG